MPFDQKQYISDFQKKNYKSLRINLNIVYDADIIKQLEEVGNKQGYIKTLIRKDIEQGK